MNFHALPPPAFFANPLMLGWLAAASAPLVIHLLNRRRFREAPWAAMQYLLAAIKKNSRRIQLEQWLLLAVRTLLIVLVVLAVCRPGFRGVEGEGEPARVHRIIVIDNTFSMSAYDESGESTYFDHAKAKASDLVGRGRIGDAYSLVVLGTPSRAVVPNPESNVDNMRKRIEELQQSHGAGDLAGCLTQLDAIVRQSLADHPQYDRREAYFITDLGRHTWESGAAGGDTAAEFKKRCRDLGKSRDRAEPDDGDSDSPAVDVSIVPAYVVRDDGEERLENPPENTAVVELSTAEPYSIAEQPLSFTAGIRHFGSRPRLKLAIEFHVDGNRIDFKEQDIAPGEAVPVAFSYPKAGDPKLTPGKHVFEVRIAADRLRVDDRRQLVIETKPRLRVLVIRDPGLTDDQLAGLNDLLLALRLKPGVTEATPLVEIDEGPVDALRNDSARRGKRLADYDCIVLANVKRIAPPTAASLLHDYVYGGGGLVTWLGDRIETKNYNELLAAGAARVLPATLGEVVAEPQYKFNPLEYKHPLMAEFRGKAKSDLLDTPVLRFFRLHPVEGSQARRALEFVGATPDALVLTEDIGAGRSVLLATSPQRSWSTLAVSPGFVPVVQTILSYAASGRPTRLARIVGEPIEDALPLSEAAKELRIVPPAIAKIDVTTTPAPPNQPPIATKPAAAIVADAGDGSPAGIEERGILTPLHARGEFAYWSFGETTRAGLYDAWIQTGAAASAAGWKRTARYAVNVEPEESDPQRLDKLDWSGIAINPSAEPPKLTKKSGSAEEQSTLIHRGLLLAALATALGETCLAGFFGRRRR